ncbi:MAG: GDSL-type esterase/lipase family protein [Cyanobacteria bacterium J06635_1]
MLDIRICFIGDSFVNGTGDPDYLGWVGRACKPWPDLTIYNLGVRRDTSQQIEQRWADEVSRRLPAGCTPKLVFSFGANDMTFEKGTHRVSPEASLDCARRILTQAITLVPILMIGPPPVADDADQCDRIAQLSKQYAQLCHTLEIPYLETCHPLRANPIWMEEATKGDGAHPGAGGYKALADLIMTWPMWKRWVRN